MANPVVFWEILAADKEETEHFYESLFGWTIDSHNALNYGFVDTRSERGIQGGISDSEHRGMTFYVEVDDLDNKLLDVEKLGGNVAVPPTPIPQTEFTVAVFEDPEGNRIGLVKRSPIE